MRTEPAAGNSGTDVSGYSVSCPGILLLGAADWDTMPLALSEGDGNWDITNVGAPCSNSGFPRWAAEPGVTAVAGDFSLGGTRQAAIALVGGQGWQTIPLAFALAGPGDPDWDTIPIAVPASGGNWTVFNPAVAGFPGWAAMSNVTAYPVRTSAPI